LADPKEPQRRTPRTLKNSIYSVPERNRVRTGLVTYMRRFGLSPQSALDEMDKVLPENFQGVIKDRTQINRFNAGAEPEDQFITAIATYLKLVEPELSSGLRDDEYVLHIGDAFTDYFMPFVNVGDYDRAIELQKLKGRSGLYVDIPRAVNMDDLSFLIIRPIANSPYARCDFFRLNLKRGSEEEHAIIEKFAAKIRKKTSNLNHDSERVEFPDGFIDEVMEIASGYMLELSEVSQGAGVVVEYGGLFCHNGETGYIFSRSILRRSPIIARIDNDMQTSFWSDLIHFDSIFAQSPIQLASEQSVSTWNDLRHYQRVKSDVIQHAAEKIPWAFP